MGTRMYARMCCSNLKVSRRGFSLLEVLIALGLMTIGILAVIGIFPAIFDLNYNAWGTTTAAALAQEKVDQLLSAGSFVGAAPVQDSPSALYQCTRQWWGAPDPLGNPSIQQLVVQITWNEKGRTRIVSLTTLLAP